MIYTIYKNGIKMVAVNNKLALYEEWFKIQNDIMSNDNFEHSAGFYMKTKDGDVYEAKMTIVPFNKDEYEGLKKIKFL